MLNMNKRKRLAKKIIDALREKAPLSTDRGKPIKDFPRKLSKKDKKRKGHVTPAITKPTMTWAEIKEEGLLPEKFWDDWRDHRDGFRRGRYELEKMIMPEKVKKNKLIRHARKEKHDKGL